MRMATAWDTHESGAGEQTGVVTAVGRKTGKATYAAADETGEGGCHGARHGVRDRAAVRQENLAGKSSGVGGKEGGCKAYGVAGEPSGVRGKP